jgi:signal peptidase I
MRLWLADARRRHLFARGAALLLVLLILAIPLGAAFSGWRAHSMTTPSMGRNAPVGSLVVTEPVSAARVHVGDVVAFHPPGRSGTTFVHRVVRISRGPQGDVILSTRGDINGSQDSWEIADSNLIGKVAFAVPDGGYALQMLPFLMLGAFVVVLVTSGLRRSRRGPARILLASLLAAGLIIWFQPLARLVLIAQVRSGAHTTAAVVPTGVLPLRVRASGGTHADLTPGQVGTLASQHLSSHGGFRLDAGVHLTGWWWLLSLTWLVPLAAAIRYSTPQPEQPQRAA